VNSASRFVYLPEKNVSQSALLALEDGSLFWGIAIGAAGETSGEVVFNTSITGYQEILTDPSYAKQIITLTQPHIGNVGVNSDDEESNGMVASGLVIRDLPLTHSNWRAEESLGRYLERHKVIAIADIDTRRLTRILRDKGAQNGCIVSADKIDEVAAIAAAKGFPGLKGMDLAKEVTTDKSYPWDQGVGRWSTSPIQQAEDGHRFKVVAYDFGVKRNILRILVERGCNVTVVPAQTPASEVLAMQPEGVFLSNGPGDPAPCDYAIAAIKEILETTDIPMFGICLGHQLLALACGAETEKMKFGHHGANHPVQDLDSGMVMITSQNHGFAVTEATLPTTLRATHRSLFDQSLQGIHHTEKPAFGFQGHPEASPGPQDAGLLFDHFIDLMRKR